MTGFGAEMKKKREAKGLSLRALADLVEVHFTTLSKAERDEQPLGYGVLLRVAGELGWARRTALKAAGRCTTCGAHPPSEDV